MTDQFDTTKEVYNKYTELPNLSYNCISYLKNNDDYIWKLLKYNDADCWKKPNLTEKEKISLIYNGQPKETDYRVFYDVGADDSWNIEACILRISPLAIIPTNYIYGEVTMGFEVYSHYKINHLSNYQTRIDSISQRLIEVFNGAEIGGLGRLFFDKRRGSPSKSTIIGSIPYKGRATIMCNHIGG